MSIISILESFWKGKCISVRSVVDMFGISKVDARVRLKELAYDRDVLREVKHNLFIGVGDRDDFVKAFEDVFMDCIDNPDRPQKIADALF